MYQIVVIPRKERHRYPYAELQVGEGFFVPDLNRRNSVNACIRSHARRTGCKYAMQSQDTGFYVIRTA